MRTAAIAGEHDENLIKVSGKIGLITPEKYELCSLPLSTYTGLGAHLSSPRSVIH